MDKKVDTEMEKLTTRQYEAKAIHSILSNDARCVVNIAINENVQYQIRQLLSDRLEVLLGLKEEEF